MTFRPARPSKYVQTRLVRALSARRHCPPRADRTTNPGAGRTSDNVKDNVGGRDPGQGLPPQPGVSRGRERWTVGHTRSTGPRTRFRLAIEVAHAPLVHTTVYQVYRCNAGVLCLECATRNPPEWCRRITRRAARAGRGAGRGGSNVVGMLRTRKKKPCVCARARWETGL